MSAPLAEDDVVATHADARRSARPPLLITEPLERFLDEHDLGAGPLAAAPVGEGHSNVTFVIARGDWEAVIRRPPRPPIPPSAHDVLREARMLTGLEGRARVPRVLATCADETVIGAPFYVMEQLEGHVITDTLPAALDTAAERAAIGRELIDALVEIHAVDWDAAGLAGLGKPDGYLERQVRRFSGIWDMTKTRELPDVERVGDWLRAHLPTSPPTTVGSFNLSAVTRAEGFPDGGDLVARYEERSGRAVADLRWYRTLAVWKACVFMETNYRRAATGASDDPYLLAFGDMIVELAARARALSRA
jgi:aminoglycoside phosphotransferase (APT) family kinase protein